LGKGRKDEEDGEERREKGEGKRRGWKRGEGRGKRGTFPHFIFYNLTTDRQ